MIQFNFTTKKSPHKIYERYPVPMDIPGCIHKVCRTIQLKQLATFSIFMEGLPNPYFNVDQDFLSISTEITDFLSFLNTPSSTLFKLHFPERSMFFEFYAVDASLEVPFKCVQKEKIILESSVPHNQLLESVETMLKHFSDLVKLQFPRAYKLFKAENIVL
jgi:hypothetical protein